MRTSNNAWSGREDPAADVSTLEAQIDQLVYDLYGLTEEEIEIVEGSSAKEGEGKATNPSSPKNPAGAERYWAS
ncbi:MAG: hypothetical protein DDT29_01372 [Dehalococcoidia bacterium]|nr:hypothetical protein [Bacillota bacterium]